LGDEGKEKVKGEKSHAKTKRTAESRRPGRLTNEVDAAVVRFVLVEKTGTGRSCLGRRSREEIFFFFFLENTTFINS
jgi:hypothetical protein